MAPKTQIKKTERNRDAEKQMQDIVRATAGRAAGAIREAEDTGRKLSKNAKRLESMVENFRKNGSKTRRAGIDLGGGITAQATTELINFGVRALGDWSVDGFWAKQVDLMQSIPHMVLGVVTYVAELLTRNGNEPTTWSREMVSEASKIFSQLGFANLTRALRVRWTDSKAKLTDLDAVTRERDQLKQQLATALAAGQKPK